MSRSKGKGYEFESQTESKLLLNAINIPEGKGYEFESQTGSKLLLNAINIPEVAGRLVEYLNHIENWNVKTMKPSFKL